MRSKLLLIACSSILSFFIISIFNTNYYLYADNKVNKEIVVDEKEASGFEQSLAIIYNVFLNNIEIVVSKVSTKLQKSFCNLVEILAVFWLIYTIVRSLHTREQIYSTILCKMLLLITITFLLNYTFFEAYFFEILKSIFNDLPLYLSNLINTGQNNDNLIQRAFEVYMNLFQKLYDNISSLNISSDFHIIVMCLISVGVLIFVIIQILFTSLIASFTFYLISSFSSFWIILSFFQITRTYTIQAINIVIATIIQMCFLFIIIGLFTTITVSITEKVITVEKLSQKQLEIINDNQSKAIFKDTTRQDDITGKKSVFGFSVLILSIIHLFALKVGNNLASKISSITPTIIGKKAVFKNSFDPSKQGIPMATQAIITTTGAATTAAAAGGKLAFIVTEKASKYVSSKTQNAYKSFKNSNHKR